MTGVPLVVQALCDFPTVTGGVSEVHNRPLSTVCTTARVRVASGSQYGHPGLTPMRPVIVPLG